MCISKIAKIGFEIEAEWSEKAKALFADDGEMKGDGSIRRCYSSNSEDNPEHHTASLDVREFASNPMVYNPDLLDTLKDKFTKLQKLHDKGLYHFNKSMGFHIHMSFTNKQPPELISPKFIAYFKKKIKKELPTVYTTRKDNQYCRFTVPPIELLADEHSDRYRFVNIWPAMRRHGTIEIRAYPSEQPMEMYKYLRFTFRTISEFIAKKQTVKAKFELDEVPHNDEWTDEQQDYQKPKLNITFNI